MSIFGKIKDSIFGHKAKAQAPAQGQQAARPAPQQPQATPQPQAAPAQAAPQQQQQVDVGQVLDEIAAAKGNPKLNYRSSIVDLMKLLDLDPSLDNRKELATELGYTGVKDGSAEMNIWLHKATMRELAANGGKVPAELLD
jgi:nucleoid-associated protein YgaU